jgi:hypothetical protein
MTKKTKIQKLCASLLLLATVSSPLISLPAEARTSVNDMTDIRADHWAYNAIKELVDKYDIMSGFPDGTFRGSRTFTRYEAAAALYKVMVKVEEMMGNRPVGTTSSVNPNDLKTIKDLVDEFRRELDAMKAANAGQFAKIKALEDELADIKRDFGKIKFGGSFGAGLDDTWEDSFRPSYSASYGFDMTTTLNESTTINASFAGDFSSEVKEKDAGGVKTKEDVEESKLDFGTAWFNFKPQNTFLNPNVKVGYMKLSKLIQAFTTVKQYFGDSGPTALANPNLNSSSRKRGIRSSKTVVAGVEVGNGPFSLAIAANPNIFAGQAKLDFGFVKVKLDIDADQTLFVGEIVQDPIHNEALILDLGNDNFGASFQANFRGVAEDWQWRAASGLLYLNVFGIEVGGAAKFENESSQQLVAGGFLKTPDKFGTIAVPTLTLALQEPLTLLNGTIYEGSNLGDKAGISVTLDYDNPYLPGLSIYYQQKANILFSDDPKDVISNSYGVSTYMEF